MGWEDGGVGTELSITLVILNTQISDFMGVVVVEGIQWLDTDLVDLADNITGMLLHKLVLFGDCVGHFTGNVVHSGGGIDTHFVIRIGVAQTGNKFPDSVGGVFALNQEGQSGHTDLGLAVDIGHNLGQEWDDRVLDEAWSDSLLDTIKVIDQVLEDEDSLRLDEGGEVGFTNDLLDLGEDGGVANVSKGVQDDDGTLANVLGGGFGQSLLKFLQEDGEERVLNNFGVTEATIDLDWVLDTLNFSIHTS